MGWPDVLRMTAGLLALAIIFYAWAVERLRVAVTRRELMIPGLPPSLEGLTICHLSDLHTAGFGRVERALRKALLGIEADIWMITGDIVATMDGLPALARVLDGFKPKHGMFGVLGNGEHDPAMPGAATAGYLRELGISVLVNEAVTVSTRGAWVQVIGVDDPYLGLDDPDRAFGGLGQADLRILLAHSPDVIMNLHEHKVDLILAGHTHGGQIRLPLLGVVWSHCRYNLGLESGYFDPEAISKRVGWDVRTRMYVSRGISVSGVRARFLCRPEIALLTLRRENTQQESALGDLQEPRTSVDNKSRIR